MSIGLLLFEDVQVANWIFHERGRSRTYDAAVGIVDGKGRIIGGVLFTDFNGANVELSYYGENTMTLGIVRCLARFVICTFNPSRCTIITQKRNKRLIRAARRLGFVLEGVQRCHYGLPDCTRNTGVRLVMFRERIDALAKLPASEQRAA